MTVVARLQGPLGEFLDEMQLIQPSSLFSSPLSSSDPNELIERLTRTIEDNESSLVAARADRLAITEASLQPLLPTVP